MKPIKWWAGDSFHADCLWCVGGMTPVGLHDDLGLIARLCVSQKWCPECGDTSVFPVEYETLDDRIDEMLGDGLVAIPCSYCNGIVAVVPVVNDGGIR